MEPHLTRIHFGKEIFPQKWRQKARRRAESEEANGEKPPMVEAGIKPAAIAAPQPLKSGFKPGVEPAKSAFRLRAGFMHVMAKKIHDQRRHHGARKQVRGQHGENYRLGQGHKKIPGRAGQKEHGHEYDANGQR
jgi:hypothetical protein